MFIHSRWQSESLLTTLTQDLSSRSSSMGFVPRLVFKTPPLAQDTPPSGDELEVNSLQIGPLALDPNSAENQVFVDHQRWILDSLLKLEQICGSGTNGEVAVLRNEFHEECRNLQNLKLKHWQRQRDAAQLDADIAASYEAAHKPPSIPAEAIINTGGILFWCSLHHILNCIQTELGI